MSETMRRLENDEVGHVSPAAPGFAFRVLGFGFRLFGFRVQELRTTPYSGLGLQENVLKIFSRVPYLLERGSQPVNELDSGVAVLARGRLKPLVQKHLLPPRS